MIKHRLRADLFVLKARGQVLGLEHVRLDENRGLGRHALRGGGAVPTVSAVEFSGEYPFAWVDYRDDSLPVRVSFETWTPFIPLNTNDSALPAVLFTFTLRNTTSAPLEAALVAAAPNLFGWDGYEALQDGRHPHYLGNQNILAADGQTPILQMRTGFGKTDRLRVPHALITNDWDAAHGMRLCENLKVVHDANLSAPGGEPPSVFWVGELSAEDLRLGLPAVLKAVEAGAARIVTGDENSLRTLADHPGDAARSEVVFEDWESGTYNLQRLDHRGRRLRERTRTEPLAGSLRQGWPPGQHLARGRRPHRPGHIQALPDLEAFCPSAPRRGPTPGAGVR